MRPPNLPSPGGQDQRCSFGINYPPYASLRFRFCLCQDSVSLSSLPLGPVGVLSFANRSCEQEKESEEQTSSETWKPEFIVIAEAASTKGNKLGG